MYVRRSTECALANRYVNKIATATEKAILLEGRPYNNSEFGYDCNNEMSVNVTRTTLHEYTSTKTHSGRGEN